MWQALINYQKYTSTKKHEHKLHFSRRTWTKEFLLGRNINISAQAETYEFSVRCTETNLIFKQTFNASFITMRHELHNKASIFEFHSLAAHRVNDTVKHKGFNDFSTLRYLKNCRIRTSHLLQTNSFVFSGSFARS